MTTDNTDGNDDLNELKDVARLKAALVKERAEHKATRAQLTETKGKRPEDDVADNPTTARIREHIAASVKAGVARETATMQQRIVTLEGELAESKKNDEALLGQLNSRSITDEVREAARASHVREEALADALTMGGLELTLVDGRVQTDDGRDVAEWLEDRKGSSPYWWPAARGAGARGSEGGGKVYSGENPFAPATFNLTKQGELMRNDPETAKVLQAQVPG